MTISKSRYIHAIAGCLFCISFSHSTVNAQAQLPNAGDLPVANPSYRAPAPHLHTNGELTAMQKYVDERIEKALVRKTLVTYGGRKVDCIDIDAQPSTKDPSFRGLQVQRPTDEMIGSKKSIAVLFENSEDIGKKDKAVACPKGTVPIPDITFSDVTRFDSMAAFFSKSRAYLDRSTKQRQSKFWEPPTAGSTSSHHHAVGVSIDEGYGAQGTFNIWNPYLESTAEFSLGQMWIMGGSGDGLQTVEAGFHKFPDLHGDSYTHLFIYHTTANYQSGSGCYNTICPAFIQVSPTVFPGAVIASTSVIDGVQVEATISWAKNYFGWWLIYDGEWVGYFPSEKFNNPGLANKSNFLEFGGEVYDLRTTGKHTASDMGTGNFASAGYQKAAYIRNIVYHTIVSIPMPMSGPGVIVSSPAAIGSYSNDSNCYTSTATYNSGSWGSYVYYGGPGYHSVNCQ